MSRQKVLLNPGVNIYFPQVDALGKLSVIFAAWLALVILTTFYCYFCEQRLFPKQRLLDWGNKSKN